MAANIENVKAEVARVKNDAEAGVQNLTGSGANVSAAEAALGGFCKQVEELLTARDGIKQFLADAAGNMGSAAQSTESAIGHSDAAGLKSSNRDDGSRIDFHLRSLGAQTPAARDRLAALGQLFDEKTAALSGILAGAQEVSGNMEAFGRGGDNGIEDMTVKAGQVVTDAESFIAGV